MHIVIVSRFNCPNTDTHTGEREREFRPELFFVRLRIERTKKKTGEKNCLFAHAQPTHHHHPQQQQQLFFFRLVVKM
jgi:hypothetical protein